jgi:23S rRNA (cytidine2498-2'-O)-methyltransferase
MLAIILLCRAGFEKEVVNELRFVFGDAAHAAEFKTMRAWVEVHAEVMLLTRMWEKLKTVGYANLVFARAILSAFANAQEMPRHGRVEVLAKAVTQSAKQFSSVLAYTPDDESLKILAPLTTAVERGVSKLCAMDPASSALHIVLTATDSAWLCEDAASLRSPFTGGLARLKMPKDGPSRSTLKLDEAFHVLLNATEREHWLKKGMTCVDLGACPGGWTYQMVRRGIAVVAIDNGAMDGRLMGTGLVEHKREDGFRFKPVRPVEWLVCDMVEQPIRVAELMALWLSQGRCKYVMCNFKLPMKKRFDEWQRCLSVLRKTVGPALHWRAKQLYHDREEITAFFTLSIPAKNGRSKA